MVGYCDGLFPLQAFPQVAGGGTFGIPETVDGPFFTVKEKHVLMAVGPARPLIPQKGHELSRTVIGVGLGADKIPGLLILIKGNESMGIVGGQCGNIQPGNVSRIGIKVVRRPRAVTYIPVSVDISPVQIVFTG